MFVVTTQSPPRVLAAVSVDWCKRRHERLAAAFVEMPEDNIAHAAAWVLSKQQIRPYWRSIVYSSLVVGLPTLFEIGIFYDPSAGACSDSTIIYARIMTRTKTNSLKLVYRVKHRCIEDMSTPFLVFIFAFDRSVSCHCTLSSTLRHLVVASHTQTHTQSLYLSFS